MRLIRKHRQNMQTKMLTSLFYTAQNVKIIKLTPETVESTPAKLKLRQEYTKNSTRLRSLERYTIDISDNVRLAEMR